MKKKDKIPNSLIYPPNEDIYNQLKKEIDINPEDTSKKKISVEIDNSSKFNPKDFEEDKSGGD